MKKERKNGIKGLLLSVHSVNSTCKELDMVTFFAWLFLTGSYGHLWYSCPTGLCYRCCLTLHANDAVGLIKMDGTEKLAYSAWKNISLGSMMGQCSERVHTADAALPCPAGYVTMDEMATSVCVRWILF
jgi:hypothetical protein